MVDTAVTVEQIMDLETISQTATLIAGFDGVKNVITYVTVTEAPDFYEWVTGGEFVLTTLYAFRDNPELRIPAYTQLAKRGVAAFGVKINRFFDEIPADIIRIANEFQIPLFEIKRETMFREVIQAISAELNNYQTNLLVEVEKHYKELAKIALVSGDFNEYLRGFGRRSGCGVYCFQSDYKLLGSYQKSSLKDEAGECKEKLEIYVKNKKAGEAVHYAQYDNLHIFPCAARGQALGYLVFSGSEDLTEKHTLMANQLTTFLTMKLIDKLETEQKMLTALLDDVLYKHNLNEEALRERLSLHGLKHKNLYRVIMLRDRADVKASFPDAAVTIYCNSIKELLGDVLIIAKPDEIVIIAANQQIDDVNPPRWLRNLGNEVFQEDCPIVFGIGPAVGNAIDIQSSYHIAKSTIKAALSFKQGGVLYYAHYLARLLLLRSVGTPEQEYLLNNVTGPLEEQDKRYNTQLLKTIGALIFADDLEQASAALYVHINTIRYRVGKIHKLTGHDFFTAKGRYVITTAYLMHCYNK